MPHLLQGSDACAFSPGAPHLQSIEEGGSQHPAAATGTAAGPADADEAAAGVPHAVQKESAPAAVSTAADEDGPEWYRDPVVSLPPPAIGLACP